MPWWFWLVAAFVILVLLTIFWSALAGASKADRLIERRDR